MDEPLSNLDAKLRVQTRAEVNRLHRRLGITTVYVTHDQVEAMTMGDRIVVMNHGFVQQVDAPLSLYNRPANIFVAGFIGSPAMNFIPVTINQDGGKLWADAGSFKVELPPDQANRVRHHVGRECTFGVRPEDFYDRNLPGIVQPASGNTIKLGVDVLEPLGDDVEIHFTSGDLHMIGKLDSKTKAAVGETMAVVFDMEKRHLFDNESEKALY